MYAWVTSVNWLIEVAERQKKKQLQAKISTHFYTILIRNCIRKYPPTYEGNILDGFIKYTKVNSSIFF